MPATQMPATQMPATQMPATQQLTDQRQTQADLAASRCRSQPRPGLEPEPEPARSTELEPRAVTEQCPAEPRPDPAEPDCALRRETGLRPAKQAARPRPTATAPRPRPVPPSSLRVSCPSCLARRQSLRLAQPVRGRLRQRFRWSSAWQSAPSAEDADRQRACPRDLNAHVLPPRLSTARPAIVQSWCDSIRGLEVIVRR